MLILYINRLVCFGRLSAIVIILILLLGGSGYAATYYVDYQGGDDTLDGLTTGTAFKHCPGDSRATSNANINLYPSDIVDFRGSTVYTGAGSGIMISINGSGTAGSPISFVGNGSGSWGTGRAEIDLANNYITAFDVHGKSHITFKGFDIYGGKEENNTAIQGYIIVDGSDNVTLEDNHLHALNNWSYQAPPGSDGYIPNGTIVQVKGDSQNFILDNNELYSCGRTCLSFVHGDNIQIINNDFGGSNAGVETGYFSVAMRITYSANNFIISNNRFHDGWQYEGDQSEQRAHAGDWIHTYGDGDGNYEPDRDPHDILIEKNFFYNNRSFNYSHGTAMAFLEYDTYNVTWRNNILINPHAVAGGIAISRNSTNINLYNNTIIAYAPNISGGVMGMRIGNTAGLVKLRNNIIITQSNNSTVAPVTIASSSITPDMDNNVFWSTAHGDVVYRTRGYTLTEWQNATGMDLNSTSGNPQFAYLPNSGIDSSIGNYKLTTGSIAIDQGATISSFSDDYEGNTRPLGAQWDVGAFESIYIGDTMAPSAPINVQGWQEVKDP